MKTSYALALSIGLASLATAQDKSSEQAQILSRSATGRTDVVALPTVKNTVHGLGSTTIDVDISGLQSWDSLSDSSNVLLTVPIPAGQFVTGVGWNVSVTTVGASWLSEARFYFDGSDRDLSGLFLTPGFADTFSGTGTYSSPIIDLTDNGIPDIEILGDGLLYIELYEGFDDVADAVDADWLAGSTLTIEYGDPPPPRCPIWSEDFDGGVFPPTGWTVVDNLGTGLVWNDNTFFGQGNTTGGSGVCAAINSDFFGSGSVLDTELWTAPIDLPANAVQLEFDMDYNDFSSSTLDEAYVDISTDGGATWTNLALYTAVDVIGHQVIDLSAYAGTTGALIRFRYVSGWDFWWLVDNVEIYTTATAVSRNAGTNPSSYTSNAPVLGGTFDATVDLSTTGHNLAGIVAFGSPLTFTLAGGQTLLVNIADPSGELFMQPLVAGPTATFSLAVPNDCAIEGLSLSSQALHFGGVMPFALSNAQDLVVGY